MGGDGKSPTVLVVDDSADIREMLRFLLERSGYRVVEAADRLESLVRWYLPMDDRTGG